MAVQEIDVDAINLGRRLALLNTGATVPISTFFDEDGDETDQPSEAVAFIVFLGGLWFTGAVASYDFSKTKH